MSKFQLFDAVSLTEPITLTDGGIAPPETAGAIVEIFKNGEAYLVELFGGWVKSEVGGDFVTATQDEPAKSLNSAVETASTQALTRLRGLKNERRLYDRIKHLRDKLLSS